MFVMFFNVVFAVFVCYSAAFCQLCFYNKDWIGLIGPNIKTSTRVKTIVNCTQSQLHFLTEKQALPCIQCESTHPAVFWHLFPKRLGIFNQYFYTPIIRYYLR